MEKFFKYLTFSLFAALIVFASCGGDDDDDDNDDDSGPDAIDTVVGNLTGASWILEEGGASLDGVTVDEWDGFTLSVSGDRSSLSYNTTNSADATVWPGSGTWSFVGEDGRRVARGELEIDVTASPTNLTLGFDIVEGRTNGIVGRWSFRMIAQ